MNVNERLLSGEAFRPGATEMSAAAGQHAPFSGRGGNGGSFQDPSFT